MDHGTFLLILNIIHGVILFWTNCTQGLILLLHHSFTNCWMRRGRGRMVVGFITTCGINACHHSSCEFESRSWRGILETTLCDEVCQWLATGRWCTPGTPVSSINKTDRRDITEILPKVALNTITLTLQLLIIYISFNIH